MALMRSSPASHDVMKILPKSMLYDLTASPGLVYPRRIFCARNIWLAFSMKMKM